MTLSAAQTLELAIAHLPPPLLLSRSADEIRSFAASLTEGRQLYFEFRLSGDDRPIDLSEHFFSAAESAEALTELAARRWPMVTGEPRMAWRRIEEMARLWRNDAEFAERIVEVGLEHDSGVKAPAIFAAFSGGVLRDRGAVARFLALVAPGADAATAHMISALDLAERHGLTAGRLAGAMLSRDAQLRCMIRGLSSDRVAGFLADLGWPGNLPALTALLSEPPFRGDAVRLVLGFSPAPVADCGIELIFRGSEHEVALSAALLRWLMDNGHAEPARVEALSAWQGAITPLNALAHWPDWLIHRNLTEGWRQLVFFDRFISHYKINLSNGVIAAAKAYLGLAPRAVGVNDAAHA